MDINQTLENLRGTYQDKKLDVTDCNKNPILQFDEWLEEAINAKCDEPNAFVLSTIKDQMPHARVVLLKGIREGRFVFYTNYHSAKGDELLQSDRVALTFLWLPLQRQVRIEGFAKKVRPEISDEYFHKRPRGSQLGAIASPQSQKVSSRIDIENLFQKAEREYAETKVLPRPENWGGYEIEAEYFEFWQGRSNRLHDRVCYKKVGTAWELYRLAP